MPVIEPHINDDPLMAEINITPFTDVLLVLLIIFMVSATFLTQSAFNIKLPETTTKETAPIKALIVTIGKDYIMLGNTKVFEDILQIKLDQEAQLSPGRNAIIRADSQVPYGNIIKVIEKLKQAGFSSISLATRHITGEDTTHE